LSSDLRSAVLTSAVDDNDFRDERVLAGLQRECQALSLVENRNDDGNSQIRHELSAGRIRAG